MRFEFSLKERLLNERRLKSLRKKSKASDEKYKTNIKYVRNVDILSRWCKKNSIKIFLDSKEENATFCQTKKEVVISTRAQPKILLYYALHECGHYLIWRSNRTNRFAEGYGLLDLRKEKTFSHKCDILDEEFEAWSRGLNLASRLKIEIDLDDFHKHKANMLKSYVRWAWWTRGKNDDYFETEKT